MTMTRQIEGEIVARNAKAKTFKIREDEGGGTFKVKVNRQTVYQGISGVKAIRIGQRRLEEPSRVGRAPTRPALSVVRDAGASHAR